MVKMCLVSLMFAVVAGAAQQTIFLDFAGQKGGDIEKLYSEQGKTDLEQAINTTMKAKDDSVYFIIETKDFSQAILASLYVMEGGEWLGTVRSVVRDETASVDCQQEKMASMGIGYRADNCYYGSEYLLAIGLAGGREFKSAREFIEYVKSWAHQFTPLTNRRALLESDPAMWSKFNDNLMAIKTTKLFSYLSDLTVSQFGYSVDLTETTGWKLGTVTLTNDQAKVAAAIDRLVADKKIYISYNVSCPAEAKEFIPKDMDVRGRIIPRNEFTEKCQGTTLMIEHLEQIYESMAAHGYTYDTALKVWN